MKKRVLVTGADGFIGSHLTELLVREGASVRALVQYNSFNSWGWLDDSPVKGEVEVIPGDVRDPHCCRELTRNVDVVFHLAALIAIPYSYRAPDSYVDTNVRGTLNMCHAALASEVEKFVHTSTSEVYGTAVYVPIDEEHKLQAQSPYSASKIGADAIATSFHCAFGLPLFIARPFNTFGPRQSARAVIPSIISQLASGRETVRLGDLSTTRDFTYVEDTCRGFVATAGMDAGFGEVFHIGSNQEISIADLFAEIASVMNSSARIETEEARLRPAGSEVFRLKCDNRKLAQRTGFRPSVPFREGLKRTAEWFASPSNLQKYKTDIYNV